MLPVAQHAFEVDLAQVETVIELGDRHRVGRRRTRDVLASVRELVDDSPQDPVALLAAPAELPASEVAAVGTLLSEAGWRVLLLVEDPEPGPPPLGAMRWETVTLGTASTVLDLADRLDELHGAGRACVRIAVEPAAHVTSTSDVDVRRRGSVSVLEVRFGGTEKDAWFSMGGGTCEPGRPSMPI